MGPEHMQPSSDPLGSGTQDTPEHETARSAGAGAGGRGEREADAGKGGCRD